MATPPAPKYPDMRPPPGAVSEVRGLPTPAGYRRSMPLIGAPDSAAPAPRGERKRRVVWFGVAVGLHAALLLGIWLMPPLRLKWSPSPEDWVQVVSLPKPPDTVVHKVGMAAKPATVHEPMGSRVGAQPPVRR